MSKSGPEKLKMKSQDMALENVETIARIFPNVVTEIRDENGEVRKGIDFDRLKQELSGDFVEGREERYEFTWVGKRQSIVEGNLPIQKTLRPCMDDSKDWENTKNIYIEGDNLEALKLLQESYLDKIKMIYIDPPYNTGNDFIYDDSFEMDATEYDEETQAVDEFGHRMFRNTKERGWYHSDWCSMVFPRLKLCKNLLSDEGVIFISIGSDELDSLIKMSNEVFGEENRIAICARLMKTGGNKGRFFSPNVEYVIVYAKNIQNTKEFRINLENDLIDKVYTQVETDGARKGERYRSMGLYQSSLDARPNQRYFIEAPDGELVIPPGESIPKIMAEGQKITPKNRSEGVWRWTYERYLAEKAAGNIEFKKTQNKVLINSDEKPSLWNVNTKIWLKDRQEDGQVPNDFISKFENRHSAKELKDLNIPFDFAKPIGLIKYLMGMVEYQENDVILDFFAGSATTAHAIFKLNIEDNGNRRFIMVQLPEACEEDSEAFKAGFKNISEIGKERIRRAGEQIKTEIEENNQQTTIDGEQKTVPDIGFRVFKIDDTNMKDVYYSAAEYSQETIEGLVDNVRLDRTDIDLLYQIVIDWGLPLDLPHAIEDIDGFHIHIVDGNALVSCFDANIPESVMRKIAGKKPLRAVFRDGSFKSSPGKLNIEGIFKTIAPDTTLRVI